MDPGTATFLGAAISGVGSLFGGSQANATNIKLAREQMKFQERMSNTSYQRAIADMKLAGLNPLLAYGQGGASTPSGATTTVNDIISPAISSARQGMRIKDEIQLLRNQVAKTGQEANEVSDRRNFLRLVETPNREAATELARAQLNATNANIENVKADTALKAAALPASEVRSSLWSSLGDWSNTLSRPLGTAREGWNNITDWLTNPRPDRGESGFGRRPGYRGIWPQLERMMNDNPRRQ